MTWASLQSFDTASLSYRVEGDGRSVVMLHGFLANSRFNWIEPAFLTFKPETTSLTR